MAAPDPRAPTALAICHRFALIRDGLRHILARAWPEMEILVASDFRRYRNLQAAQGKLACAIVESSLPGGGVPSVVGKRTRHPDNPPVLALCDHYNLQIASEILSLGAEAVAAMNTEAQTLVAGVREIMRGKRSLYLTPVGPVTHFPSTAIRLSQREREVVGLVALGMTNREIAERLSIGMRSVDGYRTRAIRKTNVKSKTELVAFARVLGLDTVFNDTIDGVT